MTPSSHLRDQDRGVRGRGPVTASTRVPASLYIHPPYRGVHSSCVRLDYRGRPALRVSTHLRANVSTLSMTCTLAWQFGVQTDDPMIAALPPQNEEWKAEKSLTVDRW